LLLRLWRRIPRNTLIVDEQCVVLVLEHLVVISSLVAYASQIGSTTVLLTHRGRGLQPLLMVRSRCASVIWVDVFLLEFVVLSLAGLLCSSAMPVVILSSLVKFVVFVVFADENHHL
jgi:hypothetical protein